MKSPDNAGNLRGVLDASAPSGAITRSVPMVGDLAPDFELPALMSGIRRPLRLSSYRGHKVVLAFYPFNWQEPSARQLISFQAQRPRVLASGAETIAVTVDSIMNSVAWEREIGPFDFPICADFWPHGELTKRYGVLEESGHNAGAARRCLIGIDAMGTVVFREMYAADESASLDEVLTLLESVPPRGGER